MASDESEAFNKFKETIGSISTISRANAFDNRMIEEITLAFNFISQNKNSEKWQEFALGLDACGRIYGYCVDNLHEEAFKIWSGVSTTSNPSMVQEVKLLSLVKKTGKVVKTLEENESAINFKDIERCIRSDPFYQIMNKKFDSSTAASMLLNNTTINSHLDLVFTGDDLITTGNLNPTSHEVNLERIINFSSNELFELEVCNDLSHFLPCPINSQEISLSEVLNQFNNNTALEIEQASSAEEEIFENNGQEEVPDFNPNSIPFEERLASYDDFQFLESSERRWFSQDAFIKEMPKKRALKRKRPKSFEEEPSSQGFCILKIEEDLSDTNLLKASEWEDFEAKRSEWKLEKGYRESRLGELFTRQSKFVGISYLERGEMPVWEQTGPLNLDPILQEEVGTASNESNLPHVNIRLLKETMWQATINTQNPHFLGVLDTIPSQIPPNEAKGLSVHTCFVAMLHLANENSLNLKKISSCDFSIHFSS